MKKFNNIQRELPKTWPTAVVYRHFAGDLDFQVPDLITFLGFMKNAGGMEQSKLSGLLITKGIGSEAVISTEELKSALRSDASWREPFISEKDGERRRCGFCTSQFQPMTGPEFKRGDVVLQGGSFATIKRYFITKDIASKDEAWAERIIKAGETFTAEVIAASDGEFKPELALAIPICSLCHDTFRAAEKPFTYVRYSDVILALQVAEERLISAKTIADSQRMLGDLVGVRPQRQYGSRATGGGIHRDRDDRDGRRPYDRNRSDFRDDRVYWPGPKQGAKLRQATATALTEAGYNSPQAALVAAESGELTTRGIANDRSLGPITNALRMAVDGRTDNRPVAGEASGAVVAPGAAAPSESATPVRARPRSMVVRSEKSPAKSKPAGKSSTRRAAGASVKEALA